MNEKTHTHTFSLPSLIHFQKTLLLSQHLPQPSFSVPSSHITAVHPYCPTTPFSSRPHPSTPPTSIFFQYYLAQLRWINFVQFPLYPPPLPCQLLPWGASFLNLTNFAWSILLLSFVSFSSPTWLVSQPLLLKRTLRCGMFFSPIYTRLTMASN